MTKKEIAKHILTLHNSNSTKFTHIYRNPNDAPEIEIERPEGDTRVYEVNRVTGDTKYIGNAVTKRDFIDFIHFYKNN